jgi:ketosteroid isomerase-like protein
MLAKKGSQNMKILLPGLLLCLGTAAASEPADDVRCAEIRFSVSAETRDADAFRSFIDADARFVGTQVTRGPDATTDAWAVFFAENGPGIKWRPQIVEVLEDGSLALSRGPYRVITKDDDGNLTEHWGTYNSIWRLQEDGSWKVVFDAGSPAAEPPAEDVRLLLEQDHGC